MNVQDLKLREELEKREQALLSEYATHAVDSLGREFPEPPDDMRTAFVRDRDRIIHCKAFRRLMHKTQVFIQPEGDHYRTRLTHTLEVAQIARTISRALCLNEDLTEAIALGHDLGHTPFGHAGERVLNDTIAGGFTHEAQGLRVVQVKEKLNLTREVLDGIANHSMDNMPMTLEGRVVRFSDKMAYIHHDIDDAIRGKIICEADLPKACTDVLGPNVKARLNTMIRDVIVNSYDKPDIIMSPEVLGAMLELRHYLFRTVYANNSAKDEEKQAEKMIGMLVDHYRHHPEELPERTGDLEVDICDYVSAMSDNYAVRQFEKLFVPTAWQVL